MVQTVPYQDSFKSAWNNFVGVAKNATFLFDRDYMDYHSDRFSDCSLLFFDKKRLVGLLPANLHENIVFSHEGLTYGGLLLQKDVEYARIDEMLEAAKCYYRDELKANILYYKPVPSIYHNYPSQEDLYWLFGQGAQLVARSLSSAVELSCPQPFSTLRKRHAAKAAKNGLTVAAVTDERQWKDFWNILSSVLSSRHQCCPVHSLDEILLLKRRFTDIRLFCVYKDTQMLAGSVIYITDRVLHAQYIAANEEGRLLGALDFLFLRLLSSPLCKGRIFFDFGISTEQGGAFLNSGLLFQKEGFGARGVCYDHYRLNLA